MGHEPAPPWLAYKWLLRQFARTRAAARVRYAQLVHDRQRHPSIWGGLRNQMYLGGEEFVARMQAQLRPSEILDEIPMVQRQPVPQSLQTFAEAYDNEWTAMAVASGSGADTLQAIAAYFGVHSSTVSRAVRRAEGQQLG